MKKNTLFVITFIFIANSILFAQGIPDRDIKRNNSDIIKRIALIIGNSDYIHGGQLSNPVNDARAMKKALEKLGFEVRKYENCIQKNMKKAIDDYGKVLKNYEVGLFFYAGHGVQLNGNNYLIPIDAKLDDENDVEYDCVRADRILAKMENAKTKVNIVILDACRDNPFERSWHRGAKGNGLAFMDAPGGSLIAYATSPGKTASDGKENNGLYTSGILEHIGTPNITIEEMFKRVRATVTAKSGNKQIPWEATSLKGNFYFNSNINSNTFDIFNSNGIDYLQSKGSFKIKKNKTHFTNAIFIGSTNFILAGEYENGRVYIFDLQKKSMAITFNDYEKGTYSSAYSKIKNLLAYIVFQKKILASM